MATNTSLTSPAWTLHHIYGTSEDRFAPSIAYDPGQGIVTVAYYATVSDLYKNRTRMASIRYRLARRRRGARLC